MDASNFHIGAGSLTIDSQDIGATTEEGMVVHYEPDVHFHLSGKYGTTPVKASLIGQKLTIEVWIAEHTLANIGEAYAGVSQVGSKIQFGGISGREIVGKELTLTPFDGTEEWTFTNAVPMEAVDANYKVNDERVIHVTFQALVDTAESENENLGIFS